MTKFSEENQSNHDNSDSNLHILVTERNHLSTLNNTLNNTLSNTIDTSKSEIFDDEKENLTTSKILFNQSIRNNNDVSELLENIGYGTKQFKMIFLCLLIIFIEGSNFTLMSAIIIPLESYFKTTPFETTIVSSIIFIGVAIGSLMVGYLSKTFGRVRVIKSNLVIMSVFLASCVVIKNIFVFCLIRIVIGFNIGVVLPIMMNILCEFLPTKNRSLAMLIVWSAFGFGQAFNLILVLTIMPNYEYTKIDMIFFYIALVITFLNTIIISMIENSPRNLIVEGKENEGLEMFKHMLEKRGYEISEYIKMKIQEAMKAGDNKSIEHNFSTLFKGKYLWITTNFTMIWVTASSLFYGPLLIYSPTVKQMVNIGNTDKGNREMIIANIISGMTNSVLIVLSAFLSEVKYFGLKNNAFFCYVTSVFFSIAILVYTSHFELLIAAYLAITFVGFNSITTIANTTYPTKIRDFALGYLYSTLRFGGFISQFVFLGLFEIAPILPYYVMLAMTIFIVINIYYVEAQIPGAPLDKEIIEERSDENGKPREDSK